jgi:Tol biopolymer transport system component
METDRSWPIVTTAVVFLLAMSNQTSATSDYSEDWGKIAFVRDGDIWTKDLPGGPERQLTTDGCNHTPKWSASGRWLAYLTDANEFWVGRPEDPTSHTRVLGPGADYCNFIWSPTADQIAFETSHGNDGSSTLSVVSSSKWSESKLLAEGRISGLTWSPDGNWIAYGTYSLGDRLPGDAVIWRVSPEGAERTEILHLKTADLEGVIVAGWSHDGQHVLFWHPNVTASLLSDGTSLKSVSVSTARIHALIGTDDDPQAMLAHPDFLDVSPVGDRLAITAGGGRETQTGKRIVVADPAKDGATTITEDGVCALYPAWSSDGYRIAYCAAPDDTGSMEEGPHFDLRRIWVARNDGSACQQLTHDGNYRDEHPVWSVNGEHILFLRIDGQGQKSGWLMGKNGGAPRRVAGSLRLSDKKERDGDRYGYIGWSAYLDWWKGPPGKQQK